MYVPIFLQTDRNSTVFSRLLKTDNGVTCGGSELHARAAATGKRGRMDCQIDCCSPSRAAAAIEIYDAVASRGLICARSRGNAGFITNDSLRNGFPRLPVSAAHPLSNRVEQLNSRTVGLRRVDEALAKLWRHGVPNGLSGKSCLFVFY